MKNRFLNNIGAFLFRNNYSLMNIPSESYKVNIEAYPIKNVGDTLGPVVVNWMLKQKNIDLDKKISKTKHLLSVGSVVSFGRFDAAIWGSGILNENANEQIIRKRKLYHRKLDIRAVRGPLTRLALIKSGYECPEIYGDPAILLPFVYPSDCNEKKYKISVILHHETSILGGKLDDKKYHINLNRKFIDENNIHFIDPITNDYKFFVNEITSSEFVVSSSLHGIILAESYGIPAVFLNFGVDQQNIKFMDWYKSTNRECVFVENIEQAIWGDKPQLPNLETMRKQLIDSFPYDLWK